MFEIGVVAHFEAAHRLEGDFGPATRQHGHTYRVEVTVEGTTLRADGTLFDMGTLGRAVADSVGHLNYCNLDELPVFAGRNSTAEAVAQHLFEAIALQLEADGLSSMTVRIRESPYTFASYKGDLDR